jgi:transposase
LKSATARPKYRKGKPVKVARKQPDEQAELLREILAELRRLNANLEKRQPAQAGPQEMEDAADLEDDDSEELEYFE